jgi:uncharacterized protein YndB with AHSA1/START domain
MNITADRNAQAYLKEEILIQAPVDKVYRVVTDINHWPEWQSAVSEAKLQTLLAEGAEFVWKVNGLRIKSRIHTVNEKSELGWTSKMFWIEAVQNWQFFEEEGNARVRIEESLSGFGSRLMRKYRSKGMIKNVIELKVFAEQKAINKV